MQKQKVIVIVGPTASGKTSLAISIAKKFNGEIISADSMQVYKGIEIASAVPSDDEKMEISHHLISFLEPNVQYSVYDFVNDAKNLVFDISNRGKLPIIVGGTGLYIDSLLNNIDFGGPSKPEIRGKLEQEALENGIEYLYDKLKDVDFASYTRIEPNDQKRIIRALEVYYSTGETISKRNERSTLIEGNLDPLIMGIAFSERSVLYDRINKRVDQMVSNGLIDEAKSAYNNPKFKGAKYAIGHKELFEYFMGNVSLECALNNLKMQTRRYAKRQITWFKRNKDIIWLNAEEDYYNSSYKLVQKFLRKE